MARQIRLAAIVASLMMSGKWLLTSKLLAPASVPYKQPLIIEANRGLSPP